MVTAAHPGATAMVLASRRIAMRQALRALNEAAYAAHRAALLAGQDTAVLAHLCSVSDMLADDAAPPVAEGAR